MNTSRFFTAYAIRRLTKEGKPVTPSTVNAKRADLMKVGICRVIAREVGNEKRLSIHQNACLTAYSSKRDLVKRGKGRNTLEGMPA